MILFSIPLYAHVWNCSAQVLLPPKQLQICGMKFGNLASQNSRTYAVLMVLQQPKTFGAQIFVVEINTSRGCRAGSLIRVYPIKGPLDKNRVVLHNTRQRRVLFLKPGSCTLIRGSGGEFFAACGARQTQIFGHPVALFLF